MGLFSKFKELVGIEDVDEDDLEEEIKEEPKKFIPDQKTSFENREQRPAPAAVNRPQPAAPASTATSKYITKEMKMIVKKKE